MDILLTFIQHPIGVVLFVTFFANTILLGVFLQKKRQKWDTVSWFSLLLFFSCIWALSQAIYAVMTGWGFLFWYGMTELMVACIMPVFVLFVLSYVGKSEKFKRLSFIIPLITFSGVLLFLYWQTSVVVDHDFSKIFSSPWGYQLPRGPVPWDAIIILLFSLYGVYELISYYFQEKDVRKKRSVAVIIFAVLLPIVGGTVFQAIIPALTNGPEIVVASPLILVMCFIIGNVLLRQGWEVFNSNNFTSDLLNIDPNAIIILNLAQNIEVVNTSLCALLGKNQGELIGNPFTSLVLGETEKSHWQKAVFEPLARGEEVDRTNATVFDRENKPILVSVHARAKRDAEGRVVTVTMVLTDISTLREKEVELQRVMDSTKQQNDVLEQTKKAMLNLLEDSRLLEEELKEERDRATVIVSSMSEGLFMIDCDYRVKLMNPMAEKLFGLSGRQVIGENLASVTWMYKGDKEMPVEERPLMQTLKTGEPVIVTLEDNYYLKGPSGDRFPAAIATAPIKRGDTIVGALVTFHDITKDKKLKETIEQEVEERTVQLKEEQARLTASINSLELGFILTDINGGIISKNPASSSLMNLPWGVKSLADVDKALGAEFSLQKFHEQARNSHKPADLRDLTLGGKFFDIFAAPIYIGGRDTDFIGTVLLIQDRTEARVLERSRDEFFSIASHELRTPLTAIRGNTSLIQDYYSKDMEPELKEMITDIHESSIRLIDIVNDFLNMGRLEQQRFEFKNEAFSMENLVEDALKEYQVTGSRKKISLNFENPATPLPKVFADKERVRQVIVNLVGNSLKFTEEGAITIHAQEHDGMVEVSVTDTGRGISLQNQALLFHKFQQAGDSLFTRDTTKGTGLGLYISKLMIEGMGGKIWLMKSDVGQGSTFVFSIPIAKPNVV